MLRSYAEAREPDSTPIHDGITYGTARELLAEVERLRADRKVLFALRNAAEHVWDITIDDPDNTDAVLELLAKPLDDAKKVFDRVIAETDARVALAGEGDERAEEA